MIPAAAVTSPGTVSDEWLRVLVFTMPCHFLVQGFRSHSVPVGPTLGVTPRDRIPIAPARLVRTRRPRRGRRSGVSFPDLPRPGSHHLPGHADGPGLPQRRNLDGHPGHPLHREKRPRDPWKGPDVSSTTSPFRGSCAWPRGSRGSGSSPVASTPEFRR